MKTTAFLLLTALTAFAADPAPEADRKAILAMAGKFKVHFHFEETLGFQPGYELTKPYDEDAHEWVVVAEDSPRRIALQHLLVVAGGKVVVHHWRQVWTYEDTRVNEFQGENNWKTRELTPEQAKGTWTQLVTQVDNSPRYESWGRWNYEGGAIRWVSSDTWRPLPRREHTKRKDYDVIGGVNTHIITNNGWAHEQVNTKLDLTPNGPKALSREAGLNTYVRDESYDFSPAVKFWEGYKEFSDAAMAEWDAVMARENAYRLDDDIEVSGLRDEIKDIGKAKLPIAEAKEKIRAAINKFLKKPAVAAAEAK
jgi:hypothetical protein